MKNKNENLTLISLDERIYKKEWFGMYLRSSIRSIEDRRYIDS